MLELISLRDFPVLDGAFCDPGSPRFPFHPENIYLKKILDVKILELQTAKFQLPKLSNSE